MTVQVQLAQAEGSDDIRPARETDCSYWWEDTDETTVRVRVTDKQSWARSGEASTRIVVYNGGFTEILSIRQRRW